MKTRYPGLRVRVTTDGCASRGVIELSRRMCGLLHWRLGEKLEFCPIKGTNKNEQAFFIRKSRHGRSLTKARTVVDRRKVSFAANLPLQEQAWCRVDGQIIGNGIAISLPRISKRKNPPQRQLDLFGRAV